MDQYRLPIWPSGGAAALPIRFNNFPHRLFARYGDLNKHPRRKVEESFYTLKREVDILSQICHLCNRPCSFYTLNSCNASHMSSIILRHKAGMNQKGIYLSG